MKPAVLRRLILTEFRSYPALRLETDGRPVVLTGPNGAGKTNLLEAISWLAPGRGLRRARIGEATRRDAGEDHAPNARCWAIAATATTPTGDVDLGTGRLADDSGAAPGRAERRTIRIDGATQRGQATLADVLGVGWLTPEMDRLFMDGASGRRRFLDRIIYGFDPAHAGCVSAYETAMRQRLKLLRDGRHNRGAEPGWLEALENVMAEKGVAMAAARRAVTAQVDEACKHGVGPFPRATLAVEGLAEAALAESPALAVEDMLRERFAATRGLDAESGRTSEGPHRSDLLVRHAEKNIPADQGSTGEQKALLIAITLATTRLQAAARGETPVLLLDEVVAHLDARRRAALFAEIDALGAQTWMTGTDRSLFEDFARRGQYFRVEAGRVSPDDT